MIRTALSLSVIVFHFSSIAGAEEKAMLQAGSLIAEFDLAKKGGVVSLRNGDVDVVSPGFESPTIFAIGLVQGKKNRHYTNLDFDKFSYEIRDGGLQLEYRGLKGQELNVVLTIETKDDYLRLVPEVRCGAETVCSRALGERLGARGTDPRCRRA